MRLVLFISILLVVTCLTCGCVSHTINSPSIPGPSPAVPGEGITNYGGSSIAIAFKSDEILTVSPEAKELFIKGLTNLTQYGQYNESLHYFDAALSIDPGFTEAWIAKGVALHNMKRYNEAITCYDKVLEIRPDDAGTWHLKGMAFRDWGKYEEAAECNRKAAGLDPRYGNG
jgi:tetratricopeptide (TPR) repeat protein